MYIFIIIVLVMLFLLIQYIRVSNKMNRYMLTIEESKSTVEISLSKRYDVISQLCSVVKRYTAHEADVFGSLIEVRKNASIADTNRVIDNQNAALGRIYAVSEAYPQLSSDRLYVSLMNEISGQNEYLAAAKRTVNSNITALNNMIVSFPTSFVAGMKHLSKLDYLKEDNIDVKKSFNVSDLM